MVHGLRPVRAGIEGDKPVADPKRNQEQKSNRQPRLSSRGAPVLAFTSRRSGAKAALLGRESAPHQSEICALNLGIGEAALHQHRVTQHGAAQMRRHRSVWQKATNNPRELAPLRSAVPQVAGIEKAQLRADRPSPRSKPAAFGLEEFLLLENHGPCMFLARDPAGSVDRAAAGAVIASGRRLP